MSDSENQAPAGAPVATPQTPADDPKGMIPYARLSEVVQDRNYLQKEVEALRAKAGEAQSLAARIAELEANHAKAQSSWVEERAFIASGLGSDPEAMDVARIAYGRLPADGKPELAEWLGSIKADPSTAPKMLQPYLQPVAPAASPAAPASPAVPKPVVGTGRPPAVEGEITPQAIRTAREQGQRTGDWGSFDALMAAFEKSKR